MGTPEAWAKANLAPLWHSKTAHQVVAGPPAPTIWRWTTLRPIIEEALQITSPEVVERRVLRLTEPGSRAPDYEATVGNITAAIQALAPGESARPHRHSMGALRFIIEGSGATTLVDGKPCTMNQGDMILTPAWCWHEHHHRGDQPAIWLDILDVPLHHHLRTIRFQPGPMRDPSTTLADSLFEKAGIVPMTPCSRRHSPKFRYTYADASSALDEVPPNQCGLRSVRYVNPIDGTAAIPFLETRLVQIEGSEFSRACKSNASRLFLVVEGQGESRIGTQLVSWAQKDIVALPPGSSTSHRAAVGRARIFEVSDRDLLARLGILEEALE